MTAVRHCVEGTILGILVCVTVHALELHVLPTAPPGGDGKSDAPFSTLGQARDAIRVLKKAGQYPSEGVTVFLHDGEYTLEEPFVLTAEDGGSLGAPLTYRNAPGAHPVLMGGRRIPPDRFQPARDSRIEESVRGRVLVADLGTLGIIDYGTLPKVHRNDVPAPEVFFNGRRMTLARWPDADWVTVEKVIRRGPTPRADNDSQKPRDPEVYKLHPIFQYAGDRPSRWLQAKDLYLHGYWCFDWADQVVTVGSIDPEKRQITLGANVDYGIWPGNPAPRRWYALNLLEELTAPGEYFLDRTAKKLYLLPLEGADMSTARISMSTGKSSSKWWIVAPIVQVKDASYLVFQGLTLEVCRGNALEMTGGTDNAILGCEVRNTGRDGLSVNEATRTRIEDCNVYDIGGTGITLRGGDRKTLAPGHNRAYNNHVYRFGRLKRSGAPGISMGGVANVMSHNLIHDGPHSAILLGKANDCIVEYNIVHHTVLESDDAGAFYKGRNPSARGNIIRYNFWHHIGSPLGHGNNAIYFDDGAGGDTVFGNVLFRCGEPGRGNMGAVFSHGGHDLRVENNLFIECKRAIGSSPWSEKRWRDVIDGIRKGEGRFFAQYCRKEVDITQPPFTTRYPELVPFMNYNGGQRRNLAVRNVAVMCGEFFNGNWESVDGYVTREDPGFVDPQNGNFALCPDSIVYAKVPGFVPIPFWRMGLLQTELRLRLPDEPWTYGGPYPLASLKAKEKPKKDKPGPVLKLAEAAGAVAIDGVRGEGEWSGTPIVIEQAPSGATVGPASRAWVRWSENSLLLCIENDVAAGTSFEGHTWGKSEAVEIALHPKKPEPGTPIQVLRGYADGHMSAGTVYVAEDPVRPREAKGIEYAAEFASPKRWTCEWCIPFSELGIDLKKHRVYGFSIAVRKVQGNIWLMWEGTRGHSYDADSAGILEFAP